MFCHIFNAAAARSAHASQGRRRVNRKEDATTASRAPRQQLAARAGEAAGARAVEHEVTKASHASPQLQHSPELLVSARGKDNVADIACPDGQHPGEVGGFRTRRHVEESLDQSQPLEGPRAEVLFRALLKLNRPRGLSGLIVLNKRGAVIFPGPSEQATGCRPPRFA